MGGTSTTSQSQTSQLAPYSAAAPGLNGILGQLGNMASGAGSATPAQTGALNQIESNANSQPNYNPAIGAGTLGLLNGGGANNNNGAITSNLGTLNSQLGATASGANIGKNPALQAQLDQIATDTTNSVNSQWAAAGRDGSPGNAQALARGIASGEAPVIAAQYNTDVGNQMAASTALYNAGNTTYGMLNGNQAQANVNFQNGIGSVTAGLGAENAGANSTLAAEAQKFGIPVSQLTTLLGAISPAAAAFGQQSGSSQGSSTMSGAQQLALLGSGLSGISTALFGA